VYQNYVFSPVRKVMGLEFADVFDNLLDKFKRPTFEEIKMAVHYARYVTKKEFVSRGCVNCKSYDLCPIITELRSINA